MKNPIAHLFYRDSDLKNGHGHRYIEKETNVTVGDPLCHWPGDSTGCYHSFYFQRSGVDGERIAWFVNGNWSEMDVNNNGFARYRDDLRKGWHIVEDRIRYIPIPHILVGDHPRDILTSKEHATSLAEERNKNGLMLGVAPTLKSYVTKGSNVPDGIIFNSLYPHLCRPQNDWSVLDLFGFLPDIEVQRRFTRMANMGYLDDELIKAFTLGQRHDRLAYDPDIRERASYAWSRRLREMVKASDEARKEADRMMVVCQGDWLDD